MSKAAELASLIGNINAGGGGVNRNLIINGAMNVNQRGTVTTSNNTDNYGIDRYRMSINNSGTVGMNSDTTVPTGQGFMKSQRIQWTSQNNTLDNVDFNYLNQPIEGQNLQHLKFGTSDAVPLTLSFWVRSNVTGNYACGLYQANGDKNFVKTYTISSADTWQYVTLTFEGNTSDTIANDNTRGLEVMWGLAFGSNHTGTNSSGGWTAYGSGGGLGYGQTANVSASASNTWYITGVQLEVGQNATTFEHEPYNTTFRKCQRYLETKNDTADGSYVLIGYQSDGSNFRQAWEFQVTKRADPSLSLATGASWESASGYSAPSEYSGATHVEYYHTENFYCKQSTNNAPNLVADSEI